VVSERFGSLSPPKKIATPRGSLAIPPTCRERIPASSVSLEWQFLQKGVPRERGSPDGGNS
jgi:hypothetical protein